MTSQKPTLDQLVREAKAEHGPSIDWSKVEGELFPRVEREARAQAALERYEGPKRLWGLVAAGLAAAAAIPLVFFARGPAASLDEVAASAAPRAGTLSWTDGKAVAHVTHGAVSRDVAPGDAISAGDQVAVHFGRAIFERPGPRGVQWSAEDGAEITVRSAGETLILALAKGAVEAQVTPVPNGEAFAIDVDGARVAVHGTHLRVERQAKRTIVDLREGVVSIGLPPKSGATYGDLVTAPAHVEFDPADPHGTLKVAHEPYRVRAALPLDRPGTERPAASAPSRAPSPPAAAAPAAVAPPVAISTPPRPAVVAVASAPPPAVASPSVSAPVPPPQAPAVADADPEKKIVAAVRACARKHVEVTDGIVITVSSRLELHIGDSGLVEAARFDPPLAPDVQQCAAQAIYGVRFSTPGAVSVPVDFTP